MNSKIVKTIEFDKIIQKLSDFAFSKEAKLLCEALTPCNDLEKLEMSLEETASALSRIWKLGRPDFTGIFNVNILIERLKIGGSLNMQELLHVAVFLETTAKIKQYFRSANNDNVIDHDMNFDCLNEDFEALMPNYNMSSEIRRCIISEDEMADDASSNLKHIRRGMLHINERIHTKLQSIINGTMRKYVQDSIITMRNGRYCIPVKQEYRANIKGMIHDQSATGSTIFVEPEEVVKLNNELKELMLEEKREIEIILSALSSALYEAADEICNNYRILVKLDFIFARAAFAKSYRGVAPIYNRDKVIRLKNARHPLLDPQKTVPIDIRVGDDFDLLIITGPNTGGKTVSLKSMGLLTMMGLSGLFIPADEGSTIYPFREIFADIGDEQSIEQSLSTFSAHMVNIVRILQEADAESLCLFDELGAGTDPVEGAALAMAILESLHSRGIRTVATTHYSELKAYALSAERVENGGCEFDVDTLSPTYRLLIGLPGKSNAFAISSKLGISDEIISAAKLHLSQEQESFEDIMASLEYNRKLLEQEKREAEKYKNDIALLKKSYEQMKEKLDRRKEKIIEKATNEADEILKEAKATADEALRKLNQSGGNIRLMEEQRHRLREERQKNRDRLVKNPVVVKGQKKFEPSKLRIGDDIRVISMNLEGTVSSLPDNKGKLFVTLGIMRMQVNLSDIELIEDKTKNQSFMKSELLGNKPKSKSYSISSEIMLIGKTVDEADALLNKYLDDAYLSGLPSVRIVHGKGTGALRAYVHSNLKNKSYIKSFKLGEFGEGDSGVTIAEFGI